MKAAQYFNRGDVRVVEVPLPDRKEHEALIAVEWAGICGSDLHEYEHGPMGIPSQEHPHPLTGDYAPVTMGHEFVGRIVSAPLSSALKPGQLVMVDPRIYCRSCSPCAKGCTHGCLTLGFKGLSGSGGGFSEKVAVDAKMCHSLPDEADLTTAALIEPLAVAWHSVSMCAVEDWSSQNVLILGGGPIGIACGLTLHARGCKSIFVSEPTTVRADHCKQFADIVLNPAQEDIGKACRNLTKGEGVDVVFDCAGVQKGLDAAMAALKFRGLYMTVAAWTTQMIIPFGDWFKNEIVIKSSMAYSDDDFRQTVEAFISGKFKDLGSMVTGRINLCDIKEKGFEELVNNKDKHIKIMVTPHTLNIF